MIGTFLPSNGHDEHPARGGQAKHACSRQDRQDTEAPRFSLVLRRRISRDL